MSIQAMAPAQPMSVGQLLDQAVRLYRSNFLTFVGIIAIVQIPLTIAQLIVSLVTADSLLLDPTTQTPSEFFDFGYFASIGSGLIMAIISFLLLQGVATAALTRAIADRYLGEQTDMIGAYTRIGSSWVRLIGVLLLAVLVAVALAIWMIVPCIGWLTGPGMLVFLGLGVLPFVAPVVVLERRRAFAAIRRAWDLTRRRFWWVLGFMFALTLFAQLLVSGPATLVGVVIQFALGDPLSPSESQILIQSVVQSIVQLLVGLVYLPLQLTAVTLVYFDLRVRTEGFDLALLAQGAADAPDELTALAGEAQPADRQLVTGRELLHFAGLTVAAVLLYFVILGLVMLVSIAAAAAFGGI